MVDLVTTQKSNHEQKYSFLRTADLPSQLPAPCTLTAFRLQDYTLDIFGVQDINSIELHANAFLEVQFRIRGGSGVRVRRTVLLSVSEGRIYKSLDVLSEVTSRLNKVYNKMADSLKLFDEKKD